MNEREDGELDLPHRGPARLVERVLAREASRIEALARVPDASPFRAARPDGARVPAVLAIEMAAQAAAAFESPAGDPTSARGSTTPGLLVALRQVRLHAPELPADADYLVRVDLDERAEALSEWSFCVRCEGVLVADGKILTYDRSRASS